MYGALLTQLADDCAGGGATREVLRGHEDDPGPSALALRLLGSVHRLVLAGGAWTSPASTPARAARSTRTTAICGGVAPRPSRAATRRRAFVAGSAAADQRGGPGGHSVRRAAPAAVGAPGPPVRDRVERRAQPAAPTASPTRPGRESSATRRRRFGCLRPGQTGPAARDLSVIYRAGSRHQPGRRAHRRRPADSRVVRVARSGRALRPADRCHGARCPGPRDVTALDAVTFVRRPRARRPARSPSCGTR